MNGSSERIPELDGVRGIAILMVLILHLSPALDDSQHWLLNSAISAASLGGTGVDLFFVLSGFLICGILIDNRGAGNYFKVFYLRRIVRIVPLYFLIILSFFTLSLLWHHKLISAPDWLMDVSIPRWSYLTFTQNFWMARLNSLGSMVLTPTWSLAVEEQFYLTFPIIVGFVPPKLLTRVLLAILTGAIISRVVVRVAYPSHDIALMVLTPCRADSLIMGALIAVAMRVDKVHAYLKMHHTKLYVIFGLLILCMALLALAPLSEGVDLATQASISMKLIVDFFRYTSFPLIYSAFLTIALTGGPRDIVCRICRNQLLRKIGTLAYCIYLIHAGIRGAIRALFGSPLAPPVGRIWLEQTILILALTFLIARLSWTCFEKPLINYGHRFRYETSPATAFNQAA